MNKSPPRNAEQDESRDERTKANSYSFSIKSSRKEPFHMPPSDRFGGGSLFTEQKKKDKSLLERLEEEPRNSTPGRKGLIMPVDDSRYSQERKNEVSHKTLVGTCQTLEKSYFRLTS